MLYWKPAILYNVHSRIKQNLNFSMLCSACWMRHLYGGEGTAYTAPKKLVEVIKLVKKHRIPSILSINDSCACFIFLISPHKKSRLVQLIWLRMELFHARYVTCHVLGTAQGVHGLWQLGRVYFYFVVVCEKSASSAPKPTASTEYHTSHCRWSHECLAITSPGHSHKLRSTWLLR